MQGWDYGGGGAYCVTICTKDRVCYFGEVVSGRMVLSDLGQTIGEEWLETSTIRTYVTLDAWVVMPNHMHGILFIQPPPVGEDSRPLGAIIGLFKSSCTGRIWAAGRHDFAWQPRFFDQVIRDEETLMRFRKYIEENPLHWERDKHYPKG
jgi:REP element-mobilizing transposase RayT